MRPEIRIRPSINVAPLVDMVLVLLIIFMVVTPAMDQDRLRLPVIGFPDPETGANPSTVEIRLDGEGVELDGDPVSWEALDEQIDTIRKTDPERRLVLRADRSTPYGEVRRLYRLCERHRFPGVSVAVAERAEKGIPRALATTDD